MEHTIYTQNGLVFWTEREIKTRHRFGEHFATAVFSSLKKMNKAWEVLQIEAPILTPKELLNSVYTEDDVWFQKANPDLVLRAETTPGTYAYAEHVLKHSLNQVPLIIWQMGKSFRNEQDQVLKNMRLKEFYQHEFQCFYTTDTLNDYHGKIQNDIMLAVKEIIPLPVRIVKSDRLPPYSLITMDVEVWVDDRWMEVCSISKRTDYKGKAKFGNDQKVVYKDIQVLEVAIGLDRLVYCYNQYLENITPSDFQIGDIVNRLNQPSPNSGQVTEVREKTVLVYWPNTPTACGRGPWEYDKDQIKLVTRPEKNK